MAATNGFVMVFRPHQRTAWASSYSHVSDFVDDFLSDRFKTSCHAECEGEDSDAVYAATSEEERFSIAAERVGHDLSALTRLDSEGEVRRYLFEPDYCGRHNKGEVSVQRAARELGWLRAETEAE